MSSEAATPRTAEELRPRAVGNRGDELVQVRGICKSFGGVQALTNVDLSIEAGAVHALCGENGAGKSTLIKILAGYYAPDAGVIEIAGEPLPPNVHAAIEGGV